MNPTPKSTSANIGTKQLMHINILTPHPAPLPQAEQGGARRSKAEQGGARRSKAEEGGARRSKAEQGGARLSKVEPQP